MKEAIRTFIEQNPGTSAEGILCHFSQEAMDIRTEISKLLIDGEILKHDSVVKLDIFLPNSLKK